MYLFFWRFDLIYMEGSGLLVYLYINGRTLYGIELSYKNYFFGDLICICETYSRGLFYINVTKLHRLYICFIWKSESLSQHRNLAGYMNWVL